MKRLVFVYGTLMRGEANHVLLAYSRRVGVAEATGFVLLDLGDYPAMIPGQGRVEGEVYDVDARTLRELDQLEGHPDLYLRQAVTLVDGREVMTYVLVDTAIEAPVIASGSWRARGR